MTRPTPTRGVVDSVVASLTERLPYKAAALFFSLVLWLVVRAEETSEGIVPVRLAATMDGSIAIAGRPPQMRAIVVGRARDLMKIGDGPLVVRRVVTADTPDSLRVELRPGDVDLPAGVNAVVRDIQPRAFTLRLTRTGGVAPGGDGRAIREEAPLVERPAERDSRARIAP